MGEGQGPKQKKHAKSKSKKRKGKAKANAAEDKTSSKDKDQESTAFNNFDSRALMSDTSGSVIILDTGASSHMMPHRDILNNYRAFPEPHKIHTADKGLRSDGIREKDKWIHTCTHWGHLPLLDLHSIEYS